MKTSLIRIATLALALVPVACAGGHAVPASPGTAFAAALRDTTRGAQFPNTSSGVHLEMVFNYNVTNPNTEKGVVDQVWGSSWGTKPAGVYNVAYIPYSVDNLDHPVRWYQKNHPDWLEYRCDKKSLAFEFGDRTNAPLDFANPTVQAFQWASWVDAPLAKGYSGIGVDTMSLTNDWQQCGHFNSSGTWVVEFSGRSNDATFRAAALQWEAATEAHVHAQSPTATMQVNYSYEFGVSNADNLTLMTTADLIFDERGFTNWGAARHVTTLAEWRGIVKALLYVESKGGCYMTNAEEPGQSKNIDPAERQWVIANYLLVKNDCTYMYMTGYNGTQQGYGSLILFPEYSIAIGTATGAMTQGQGAYARAFTNGLAIVNPTGKAVQFALPSGTYHTVTGQVEASPVSLAPATGLVLLK